MADNKTVTGEFYKKPPKLGKWDGFKLFLWNPEHKTFLDRTAASWAKILIFYAIFYTLLIAFFMALLAVFNTTLDERHPKWQLNSSLIGTNPGLGFRPMPPEVHVESTLIWYNRNVPKSKEHWIKEISKFLEIYERTHSQNQVNCSYTTDLNSEQVCSFNVKSFGPCYEDGFQYNSTNSGPCIFLKLNKIYNWIPEVYNNVDELPEKMPKSLKNAINELGDNEKNTIWVSCEGENVADIENIGTINYYPFRGFPGYFYPYSNKLNYLSPIVAVHFEQPKKNVVINVECKAWAKNIFHDRQERRGSVHFELLID